MSDASFFILSINPEPWAIGTAYAFRGKGGAGISPNKKLVTYKAAVAELLTSEYNPAMVGPKAKVILEFWFSRNTAPIKTSGKMIHPKVADATNLQKALEDALQGVLYPNDQNVTQISSTIVDQGPDVVPEIMISMQVIEHSIREHLGRRYLAFKKFCLANKPKIDPLDSNDW